MTARQYQFREGDQVYSADGDKVGKLIAVSPTILVVEKGWLFPNEYDIPVSAIANYDDADGKIYLSLTKDEALHSGWDNRDTSTDGVYGSQPGSMTADSTAAVTNATTGMGAGSGAGLRGTDAAQTADATKRTAVSGTGYADPSIRSRNDRGATDRGAFEQTGMHRQETDDDVVIPVHEEHLEATRTPRQAGEVRVNKQVIEEDQTLNVPVTEEKVNVTRRTVNRDANTGAETFRDETIAVPLQTEDVNVEPRTRVTEEVRVNKEAVQRNKQVGGTVRKETVDIDNTAALEANRTDEGLGASS
jgi:uncharacterized protein (TIGR02271 family)